MSVVSVTDPGYGSPLRVVYRISAQDAGQAVALAKVEARNDGYAVKTLGWVTAAGDGSADWDVQLIARPKA